MMRLRHYSPLLCLLFLSSHVHTLLARVSMQNLDCMNRKVRYLNTCRRLAHFDLFAVFDAESIVQNFEGVCDVSTAQRHANTVTSPTLFP